MSPEAETRLFEQLVKQGWSLLGDAAVGPHHQYWLLRADCVYYQIGSLHERMSAELDRLDRGKVSHSSQEALQDARADLRGLVAALEALVYQQVR